MKLDYEFDARLAIAKKIWEQFRAYQCLKAGTGVITDPSKCNVNFEWDMYKDVFKECKTGVPSYKFENSDACVLNFTANKKELETFIDSDKDVKAGVAEFDWDVAELKDAFTEEFYKTVETYLRDHIDEESPYLTDEQGQILVAHCILTKNDYYESVIGIVWKYACWGFHYWQLKYVKIGVAIAVGVVIALMAAGAGAMDGGSSSSAQQSVSQSVVIQLPSRY